MMVAEMMPAEPSAVPRIAPMGMFWLAWVLGY